MEAKIENIFELGLLLRNFILSPLQYLFFIYFRLYFILDSNFLRRTYFYVVYGKTILLITTLQHVINYYRVML